MQSWAPHSLQTCPAIQVLFLDLYGWWNVENDTLGFSMAARNVSAMFTSDSPGGGKAWCARSTGTTRRERDWEPTARRRFKTGMPWELQLSTSLTPRRTEQHHSQASPPSLLVPQVFSMSSRAAVHHPKISSRPLPDAELVAWPIAFTRVRAGGVCSTLQGLLSLLGMYQKIPVVFSPVVSS